MGRDTGGRAGGRTATTLLYLEGDESFVKKNKNRVRMTSGRETEILFDRPGALTTPFALGTPLEDSRS